jgi:hypothetical protein
LRASAAFSPKELMTLSTDSIFSFTIIWKSAYIDVPQEYIDQMELEEEETIANGGAALAAYSKLQFSDLELTDALSKALLC